MSPAGLINTGAWLCVTPGCHIHCVDTIRQKTDNVRVREV